MGRLLTLLILLGTYLAGAGPQPAAPRSLPLCGVIPAERVLADFEKTPLRHRADGAVMAGARIAFREREGNVTLLAPKGGWDLSKSVVFAVDLRNEGDKPLTVLGTLGGSRYAKGFLHLAAGAEGTMVIHLMRTESTGGWLEKFPAMRGVPGGHMLHWDRKLNFERVHSMRLADLDGRAAGGSVTIRSLRALGTYGAWPAPGEKTFFPFVDTFGQFKHAAWPGKIGSVDDLSRLRAHEAIDLADHPGPQERSRFGGWKGGPKLEASGHFRTARHGGKWWLVDPEGYLFWSHGVTGVGGGARTKVNGRRHFFASIPETHRDRGSVDFFHANLERKYGAPWEAAATDLAHRRLRSWGMNTLGNWSERTVWEAQQTPYVVPIHYGSREGDPRRDPALLRRILRARLATDPSRDDPWCIGYFIDNELKWNEVMDPELYYKSVSEVVREVAPKKLYLGSRLHGQQHVFGGPENAAKAAAKYCDVVGINRYRFSPSDLRIPDGFDKPILIGEFHVGALDRGMLHPGLRGVGTQEQRGHAYRHYVTEALRHPHIVGTHWFQYREQAVTGRSDGENYQIGFVDITDTPSMALIEAARGIGERMYRFRMEE